MFTIALIAHQIWNIY